MSDNGATRCGFTVIDSEGNEQPCDRPATGWRWYQDCDHEDMLDVACSLHANEGGQRIHEADELKDRLDAVRAWAMVNEIAAVPLDWAGLGAVLAAEPSGPEPTTSGDPEWAQAKADLERSLDETAAEHARARAQVPTTGDHARVLAKHQLADILPGGVVCTCGAELAALKPPLDDGAGKGEPRALAVHQLQEMELTTSDEPARCNHGHTGEHGFRGLPYRCAGPGPTASGTPEAQR
jgi:hypothetical protein